jgi:hypothetical protein
MHARAASAPPGMLVTWMNVDSAHDDDFNRWYDREHLEERVRIPGFVSGARYQSIRGSRRYLGLYRTTSLEVFKTPAYRDAFQHQTPWSVTNLSRMQNAMRRVCAIQAEAGAGTGSWLAVLRLGASAIGSDAAEAARLGAELLVLDGVVASRLLVPDPALSTPLPAENPQGRELDPMLLVETSSEPSAASAGRRAAEASGVPPANVSLLQLMWQLRDTDLHD